VNNCNIVLTFVKDLHRALIYVLLTAIIEVPSIVILYSLGYPSSPSSNWMNVYDNVMVFYIFFVRRGTGDSRLDLVGGVLAMLLIIAILGESIYWLSREVREGLKKKEKQLSQA